MYILCIAILFQGHPFIHEMVDSVSTDSIVVCVQRLQDFWSRIYSFDSCFTAAAWIENKFIEYGLDSVYEDTFSIAQDSAPGNVVGIKIGTVYPDSCYYVICGHFDSWNHFGPTYPAPGADDNASGTAAVIEAARVMSNYQFEYSIRFIALSAEELGMIGSGYYAYRASERGDDIRAVYNYDMIGYVDQVPENLEVCSDTASEPLIDQFIACADTYTTLLTNKRLGSSVSDDWAFRYYGGYQAIGMIEDLPNSNPYYHSAGDTIGSGFNDPGFCTEVIKAAVAALASGSRPYGITEQNDVSNIQAVRLSICPNPFRYKTTITVHDVNIYPFNENIVFKIFDVTGRERERFDLACDHTGLPTTFTWDVRKNASTLPSGVYVMQYSIGQYTATEKLLLVR